MGRLFYFCRRIKHIKIEKYDSKLVRSESEIRESRRRWEREKNVRVVFVGCDVLYGGGKSDYREFERDDPRGFLDRGIEEIEYHGVGGVE